MPKVVLSMSTQVWWRRQTGNYNNVKSTQVEVIRIKSRILPTENLTMALWEGQPFNCVQCCTGTCEADEIMGWGPCGRTGADSQSLLTHLANLSYEGARDHWVLLQYDGHFLQPFPVISFFCELSLRHKTPLISVPLEPILMWWWRGLWSCLTPESWGVSLLWNWGVRKGGQGMFLQGDDTWAAFSWWTFHAGLAGDGQHPQFGIYPSIFLLPHLQVQCKL